MLQNLYRYLKEHARYKYTKTNASYYCAKIHASALKCMQIQHIDMPKFVQVHKANALIAKFQKYAHVLQPTCQNAQTKKLKMLRTLIGNELKPSNPEKHANSLKIFELAP